MKTTKIIVGLIILLIVLVGAVIYVPKIFNTYVDVGTVVTTNGDGIMQPIDGEVIGDDQGGGNTGEDLGFVPDPVLDIEKENMDRLSKGCIAGKDCIPSIDNPKFISAAEANYLQDEEFVIGLYRNDEARAYPLSILNWHEIVNDQIGDDYIAISFCPLCYTGNAFIREVNGSPTEFGVSGYLLNSNLVMYDRNTDSLWQQLTGEAITGPQLGNKLKKITVSTLPWSDWVEQYPNTKVLSTDTGFNRDYKAFPYGDYNTSRDIFFSVENKDDRLFEKELTYGIVIDGNAKAYARADLERQYPEGGTFPDMVTNRAVTVTWEDGTFTVLDIPTGEEVVAEINFWFAWVAFYPDTQVWDDFPPVEG